MSTPRAKDVTFSSLDQANQTMILDLGATAAIKTVRASGEEPTLVLDLSATQIHTLLENTEAEAKKQGRP
jgi:hypothetical protein